MTCGVKRRDTREKALRRRAITEKETGKTSQEVNEPKRMGRRAGKKGRESGRRNTDVKNTTTAGGRTFDTA